MGAYVEPNVFVEEFEVSESVAACEPSTEIKPVDVACLIESGEADGVFYSGGCSYVASSSNLITLNGHQYLYWYGSAGANPQAGGTMEDGTYYGQKLMTELTKAGVSQKGSGGVLHAGLASPTITSILNQS